MAPSFVFQTHDEVINYKGSNTSLDYIDHELSAGLDSSDAFEGPEKLLEIWFSDNNVLPENWNRNGLRAIPLVDIEEMLSLVNCQILSKISGLNCDAYLLSESSLFVYKNKMILKTCGRTTILSCIPKLASLISSFVCPQYNEQEFKNIYQVFYSHRTFMFPQKQLGTYQSWDNELACLNQWFDNGKHKSYVLGDQKDAQWHLYINGMAFEHGDTRLSNRTATDANIDTTIEIHMTGLDADVAAQYYMSNNNNCSNNNNNRPLGKDEDKGHVFGNEILKRTKLDCVLNRRTTLKHDAFAFDPCGFSSNSIVDGNYYYTVHITPEQGWSYASFETNHPCVDLWELLHNVLPLANPREFTMVICSNDNAVLERHDTASATNPSRVPGYVRHESLKTSTVPSGPLSTGTSSTSPLYIGNGYHVWRMHYMKE